MNRQSSSGSDKGRGGDRDKDRDRERDGDRRRDKDDDELEKDKDSCERNCCMYLRWLAVWLATFLAGGVTAGVNLFIPMFANAGLYGDLCGSEPVPCKAQYLTLTSIFSFCASVSSVGFIPAGLIFDMAGARVCSVLGVVFCAVGAVVLSAALFTQSSALAPLAFLSMDVGNTMTANSFFGLMWHMPERQGLLFSIATGSTLTAAVLPLILQYVMLVTGVSFPAVFLVYALFLLASCVVLWIVVPSQEEFLARATFVLGIPVYAPRHTFKSACSQIRMSFRVLRYQARDIALLVLASGSSCGAMVPYYMLLQPYETTIFADEGVAKWLVNSQEIAFAVMSVVAAVGTGFIMDKMALGAIAYCMSGCVMTIVIVGTVKSVYPQIFCILAQCWLFVAIPAILTRFSALWSPSNRYGMVSGLVFGCHLVSFVCCVFLFNLMMTVFDGLPAFAMPMRTFGVMGLCMWASTGSRWNFKKFCTILLEGDEEELMDENFGLKTFEDAEVVLRMSREEILSTLASQDLKVRRKLIDMMNDPEVQVRWAQRAFSQGYDMPELEPHEYMFLVVTDLENTLKGMFCCMAKDRVTPREKRATPRKPQRY